MSEPVGTLEVALAHTARLLETQPALAAEQATEILKAVPGHPAAQIMLAIATRLQGDAPAALLLLEPLVARQPSWAQAHYELGLALLAVGRGDDGVAALRRAVQLKPDHADGWRALGDHLTAMGDAAGADAAYLQQVRASTRDPRLLRAADALYKNEIPTAEVLLKEHLKQHPTDVAAIRMLAEVAARLDRYADAAALLARCLELAPSFVAARRNYAMVLQRQNLHTEALVQANLLLEVDWRDAGARNLKAAVLGGMGRYDESILLYEAVLADFPGQARVWLNYGHALKTTGRTPESIGAYRRAIELEPGLGSAYWSLANLKTFRFTAVDVALMRAQLRREDLVDDERLTLSFALAKALEDEGGYAESFEHYDTANRIRRKTLGYNPERTARRVQRSREVYTREFFAARAGYGCDATDPIFIVGMPRAGSTLVEQILASHSAVEGTMELPDIISMTSRLSREAGDEPTLRYPRMLAGLGADECRALGEEFLERTRIQRLRGTPFFIDKMPNNFAHVGFIHLILPNAKIIDARRHPLGCCFSGFKQHFARGQNFSYGLEDIGRYYRDYVELMAHIDEVLPGRVHRVIYENMVADTEGEIRRLLAYCGLPFEEACLRYYENDRAVRTASSEQVRKPIFRDAVEHWRHFEPWLGPLKVALGPVLESYPLVPHFASGVAQNDTITAPSPVPSLNLPEPMGSLDLALGQTTQLMGTDPRLAAEQASEILKVVPGHLGARLLLGRAHRLAGDTSASLEVLEPLVRDQPEGAAAQHELGAAFAEAGRSHEAVAALRRAVQLKPDSPDAWRLLADCLDADGDSGGADQARAEFIKTANRDPRLMAAAAALCENDLPRAEALLRAHLREHDTDVTALRMLAEVAARLRRYSDAQTLLEHCLELAPSFIAARHNYAVVLHRQGKPAEALRQIERLLAADSRDPGYRNLHAAILANLGDVTESIEVYESVLKEFPRQARVWMSLGHALKTGGRQDDSVQAYRQAIALEPSLGEAYWSLANLKTFRFTGDDIAAMRSALARSTLAQDDRLHFDFALGKALEDAGAYEASFAHYAAGSRIRLSQAAYDPDETAGHVRRSKALYTPGFLADRRGGGAPAEDPIFIVGLPRAGSTLLEQILSSHSLVEGTMELPDIPALARDYVGKVNDHGLRYPEGVAQLSPEMRRELGERYLAQTRVQRKTDAPYFIDKLPNNFAHVGFIHLILPNAKIIDARRHPLGCCFSAFKQHFARGQNFSYSLEDVGRYYRDYVELMAHMDAVLPGRVHRVFYEQMVDDTETQVHRLLDYCGLPFEAACLRFYENERAVRTASSEQVRRPIYRDGVDHWRHYEPWLGPLRKALGPVLDLYPEVPDFAAMASR